MHTVWDALSFVVTFHGFHLVSVTPSWLIWVMTTSSSGNCFHVTGPLWGEFTGDRWIHKGQWRGALLLSLICTWTNGWAIHRYAGDLRRHRGFDDVTVVLNGPNRSIRRCYDAEECAYFMVCTEGMKLFAPWNRWVAKAVSTSALDDSLQVAH